jgi:hypothetical protein
VLGADTGITAADSAGIAARIICAGGEERLSGALAAMIEG